MIKNKLRTLGASLMAAICITASAGSAYADDFYFDMAKARQTFGNGQSYNTFTCLDGEKRDLNKFNPLWLTEESDFIVDFVSEGEYENDTPVRLVFQSWTGELVSGTEEKWVQISPSELTENQAIFTYEDIIASYGADFSDVYSIVFEDCGNALLVKSVIATNCEIPDEEIPEDLAGTIVKEGEPAPGETLPEETTAETTIETTVSSEVTSVTEETTDAELTEETTEADSNSSVAAEEETNSASSFIVEKSSMILIIFIAVFVIAIVAIIAAVVIAKKKNRNYHRFK